MSAAGIEETASTYSPVSDLSGNALSRSTTIDSLHHLNSTQGSPTSPLQRPQSSATGPNFAEGPLQDLDFELPSATTTIGPLGALATLQDRRASRHILDSDGRHHVPDSSYVLGNLTPETGVYQEVQADQHTEIGRQQSPDRNRSCCLPLSRILGARPLKSRHHPDPTVRELRRHKSALCIISAYSIVTVAIWTLTCVLSHKPISFATYYDETGWFSDEQYRENDWWRKFAKVMPSLLGTISIPVTYGICAQAAAIYSLRRSKKSTPGMTMEQRLALENKGLLDNGTLRDVRRSGTDRIMSNSVLILSAFLCILAIIIWGLQAGLIDTVLTTAFTSADATASPSGAAFPVGSTLFDLDFVPNNEISEAIISGDVNDLQGNLWPMESSLPFLTDLKALYNQSDKSSIPRFFTTSIPVGTDTGVLRAIALRLNSSLSCEAVLHTDLPPNCYEGPVKNSTDLAEHTVRICVSGDVESPTGEDRRNVLEDYWFTFQAINDTQASSVASANGYPIQANKAYNFNHHCQQNTTLAYFELPNHWNNHTVQDIINVNATGMKYQTGPNIATQIPTLNSSMPMPGFLLTSIFALFDKNTFQPLINAPTTMVSDPLTCSQLHPPFTTLLPYLATILNISAPPPFPSQCTDTTLSNHLHKWLQAFSNPDTLTAALTITNLYISQAMLDPSSFTSRPTRSSSNQTATPHSATIFASRGLEIQKLQIALPAMVLISVLMLIQLVGLWGLAVYASCYGAVMGGRGWVGDGDGDCLKEREVGKRRI